MRAQQRAQKKWEETLVWQASGACLVIFQWHQIMSLAYVEPNKQKVLLCPFFLPFHYLPNDFSARASLKLMSIGFDRNLSFINSRPGTHNGHLIWHFSLSSVIFFLIVIKWISLCFSLTHTRPELLFFVVSSFSCETLYGELHLVFVIVKALF